MRDSPHPTLAEISVVLAHMAERVLGDRGPGLDPFVPLSVERAVVELRRHIPGLDLSPDSAAARSFADAAAAALTQGHEREALARALRGLSRSPQDPNLHYLAGSACFELGAVETAVALIAHALWVNPGHRAARRDLEALDAFREAPKRRARSSENVREGPRGHRLRFEFIEDDENEAEGEERAA